jgi:hypothetical protein
MNENKDEVVDAELYPVAVGHNGALALQSQQTPEVILARARKAAVALKDVVDHKIKPVKMNGETYLEFEDWQTLGNFYNMAAKVDSTNFVQFGKAQGFEAKASVIDKTTGAIITAAESMCLNDEEKWCSRTKYEYHYCKKSGGTSLEDPGKAEIIWEEGRPKKQKINAGMVAVPLFQLRSMAQTRACAKAYRNALSWVVVLAGYKPTPAEELDGMTDKDTGKPEAPTPPAPHTPPQRKSEQPVTTDADLAAKAESKRKELAENAKAIGAAGKQSTAPAKGLMTATGLLTGHGEPNAGGYVAWEMDNHQREDGKQAKFASKDMDILNILTEKMDAGEKVTIEYKPSDNPRFAHNIVSVKDGIAA